MYRRKYELNDQESFLRNAKDELQALLREQQKEGERALRLTWGAFAEKAGISPRALKTYRQQGTDFRPLPPLAKRSIEALLSKARKESSVEGA